MLRDLFQGDDGGWLQDVALMGRLVAKWLEREAEAIRAEGWRWIEVAPDFPYGHSCGLRQLRGETVPPTEEEAATREALHAEYNRLEEAHADIEDLPETVDQRLAEIEGLLAALDERPVTFDPAEVARAGAFVSIGAEDRLQIERGYVRPACDANGRCPFSRAPRRAPAPSRAASALRRARQRPGRALSDDDTNGPGAGGQD